MRREYAPSRRSDWPIRHRGPSRQPAWRAMLAATAMEDPMIRLPAQSPEAPPVCLKV